MKRLLLSIALVAALAAGAAAQDWQWRPFTPPDLSFAVDAPGPLKPDAEALDPGSGVGSYSYSDFYGYFGVVFRSWSKSRWRLKPDFSNHYRKVRDDFVKASKGTLVSEEKWTKGEVTGRNVMIRMPYGTITGVEGKSVTKYRMERIRMMFVGQRFYMLIAVLPPDIVSTPTVDRFFDTFEPR